MTRLEANRQIVELLHFYIEKFPDLRFEQIISNFGIHNFYREPTDTLKIVIGKLNEITLRK